MKDGLMVDSSGNKFWWLDGLLHRECKPSIIMKDGTEYWYKHGKLHRDDGPAISFFNKDENDYRYTEWWYKDNKLVITEEIISELLEVIG